MSIGPVALPFARVIDGDTLEAWIGTQRVGVGLIGITAPQGNTNCGQEAAGLLWQLTDGGLRLEEDAQLVFDARNRRTYYADTPDGRSIGAQLVQAGVARADGQGQERDQLAAAEAEARAAQRGCLWRPGVSTQSGLPATTNPPSAAAGATPPAAASLPPGFSQEVIARGLDTPTAFAFLPDGRILIALKHGIVRLYQDGQLVATPFLDIHERVNDYWDRGLIGLAVDPDFASNGYVYLAYTYENDASQ